MFLSLFAVNLAPLKFSFLEPQLAPETAWRPSRYVDLPLSFLSCPLFLSFFLSFSLLFLFFLSFFLSLSLFFFLSFFSFFLAPPLVTPEGPSPKAPQDTSLPLCCLYPPDCLCLLFFFVLSSRKLQPILQKVESRGRCCLLTFLPYFFDFPLVNHPPMPCRLILCVSKTYSS